MPIDAKHDDLQSLRIDRMRGAAVMASLPLWARRYILIGIGLVVLLGVLRWPIGCFRRRARSRSGPGLRHKQLKLAGVVLSASGYIVAHHKINVNSKVTGRVKWIGVEKGDKVKEGQILVRLEDDEFRAQYEQAQRRCQECPRVSRRTPERIASRRNAAGPAQSRRSPSNVG